MGLFSKSAPKPPKGTTYKASGKDRLEKWSYRRLMQEQQRLEQAKAFRDEKDEASKTYMRQLRKFNEQYLPVDQRGDMRRGRGGMLTYNPGGLSLNERYILGGNNEFSARGNAIRNADATYDRIVAMSEKLQNPASSLEPETPIGMPGQRRSGYMSRQTPEDIFYANIDTEQFNADFAKLQESRLAFDERRSELQTLARDTRSGLGGLDIGDKYWQARVDAALANARIRMTQARNSLGQGAPRRVDPEVVAEREQQGVASAAARPRGGGGTRRGPLEVSTVEPIGVI